MAAPVRLREKSRLQGEQREGWSEWKRAMVPPDSNARNLEPRRPGQVGKMSSSIEHALGNLAELCGIYEWRAKGTRRNQPNNVVYVGSTCVRRRPQKLGSRIIRYCKYGNHKKDLINTALERGYELWVRVKSASDESSAQTMENELLRDYNYAWNKRQNGGDDGIRDILPVGIATTTTTASTATTTTQQRPCTLI